MPLVRINLGRGKTPAYRRRIGDIIYTAMVEEAGVPENDKFQIISEHEASDLVYPESGYMGVVYSAGLVFIQITWLIGRSVDIKKRFYKRVAEDLQRELGIRMEDVWISLIEVKREDWSFGNGLMQYGPE